MAKPKLSTVLISLALFLFFSFLLFPYQNLRGYIFGAIYKQTQILVMAGRTLPNFFRLAWPGNEKCQRRHPHDCPWNSRRRL